MKNIKFILVLTLVGLPMFSFAQDGVAGTIKSLHQVLDQLYEDMLPLCSDLISVGRAIAGFAALFYIGSRIWRHIANAEPVDVYPLLRPFVIGFAILIFPSVIALINGILQPIVTGTESMVDNTNYAVEALLKKREETPAWQMYVGDQGAGDRDMWYKYTHPDEDLEDEGLFDGIGNDIKFAFAKAGYNLKTTIKEWMSNVLQVLFQAAALCINTLRTFNLIVLAILGPIVFGLSVFDGFHHTLRHWLARYINIFLWLPIANIFGAIIGKIQENMLTMELQQIAENGDSFFTVADTAYLIFMIIGIVGYFTVPSVANYIVHSGGGGAHASKVTGMAGSVASTATGVAGKGAMVGGAWAGGRIGRGIGNIRHAGDDFMSGYNTTPTGKGISAGAGRATGRASNWFRDKLGGK